MEGRGLVGVGSFFFFFPSHGFKGLNSGHQVWQEATLLPAGLTGPRTVAHNLIVPEVLNPGPFLGMLKAQGSVLTICGVTDTGSTDDLVTAMAGFPTLTQVKGTC